MDQEAIIRYIRETFHGIDVLQPGPGSEPAIAIGDTFFSYDPDGDLPANKKFPFATIVTKDYFDFDNKSNLNREGVFRLNIGVSRKTFEKLFGPVPKVGGEDGLDYAILDSLMPHPVYAPQAFVCILNPEAETFERVKPLIKEAYEIAVTRFERKGIR